jgi:hypothetical protein
MARVSKATFVLGAASILALAAFGGGCQNDKGSASTSSDTSGGRVISQNQTQDVTPEGTAIQTRTQVRETPSGQQVRETQMRTREVVTPQSGSTGTGTGTGSTSGSSSGTR